MKLILGTVQFGLDYGINNSNGRPSEFQVFEMLNYAHSNGLTKLDTAEAYGNASELIGNYNVNNPEKFIINTKFIGGDLDVSKQLNTSLKQLNTDFIDVYFYHSFDDFINYPNLKSQLHDLKEQGLIKKIGLSVYENDEFIKACNSDLIDVIQFPFNLLDNLSQRGAHIKRAKNRGKELHIRSVFLQGLFFKPLSDFPLKLKPLLPYIERIHEIAEIARVSIEQLALSYALQQSEIDNVIFGVDSIKQLKKNIEMSKMEIAYDIIEAVNKISVKEIELLYPKNW